MRYGWVMSDSGIGLREIKKQMTRESIADAALHLALEKGLDDVTIEEIAQLAFVSPRTFSNYFSCKEEAVATAGTQHNHELLDELAARPSEEAPLDSLATIMVEAVRNRSDEELAKTASKLRLSLEHPSLRAFQTAQYDALEVGLREVLAARMGRSLDDDLYPWLVTSVAIAAVKSATALWLRSGAGRDRLTELVTAAFDQVGEGLPALAPAAATAGKG